MRSSRSSVTWRGESLRPGLTTSVSPAPRGAPKICSRAVTRAAHPQGDVTMSGADDRDDEDQELDALDGDEEGDAVSDVVTAADGELPEVSRKIRRRRRRTRPRSKTIAMKRLTREELRQGALMYPPVDIPRPTNREECSGAQRPCPWVAS